MQFGHPLAEPVQEPVQARYAHGYWSGYMCDYVVNNHTCTGPEPVHLHRLFSSGAGMIPTTSSMWYQETGSGRFPATSLVHPRDGGPYASTWIFSAANRRRIAAANLSLSIKFASISFANA